MEKIDTYLDKIAPVDLSETQADRYCVYDGETRCPEVEFDGSTAKIKARGNNWTVGANYSSKSKLVQGDILVHYDRTGEIGGQDFYKVIKKAPFALEKAKVQVLKTTHSEVVTALVNDTTYHINPASVSFYNLEAGDEISVMIPVDSDGNPVEARFCAVSHKVETIDNVETYKHLV